MFNCSFFDFFLKSHNSLQSAIILQPAIMELSKQQQCCNLKETKAPFKLSLGIWQMPRFKWCGLWLGSQLISKKKFLKIKVIPFTHGKITGDIK